MSLQIKDLRSYLERLEAAIHNAMQAEVTEAAKQTLAETAKELVYDAYEPKYYDRWGEDGGVLDTSDRVMKAKYDPSKKMLEVVDDPEWHNPDDGAALGIPLAEAIEKGIDMGNAGPRPFHADAEKRFADSGDFAAALVRGLRRNGFD